MARPQQFNRDDVLDAAIRVFARHGYAAASTTDLLDEMSMSRQSVYGAFGDKRGLFLEALARYSARSVDRMRDAMVGESTAAAALEAALLLDLGRHDDVETGCLGVGSIAEFGRSDPDINGLNDKAGIEVIAMFAARLQSGTNSGEFRSDLDPAAAGRMLLALKSGLKVAARGGADTQTLTEMARLAVRGFAPASAP